MPKIRRKDRQEKRMETEEDSVSDDGVSVCSNISEAPTEGDINESDLSSTEAYEEKICSVLEAICEKNLKTRVEGLKSLKSGLSKKFAFDFISTRSLTISDSLDKCLKKGRGEEQKLAAQCHALLLIQLAPDPSTTLNLFNSVVLPSFKVLICDEAASLDARCACLESLALCVHFSVTDQLLIREVALFVLAIASTQQHAISLQVSGLQCWSLLFPLLTPEYIHAVASDHLLMLTSRLESSSTELRIAAGEAIAVVYEAVLEADEDFEYHQLDKLCEVLLQLSKQSGKSLGKKDKKQQKASFRDVLKFVEDGDFKEVFITISKREQLSLQSWSLYLFYEALCSVLKSGTPLHLKENPVVREIFDLGDVLEDSVVTRSKYAKMVHKSAFKELTKHRQKQRTKKTNSHEYME